MQILGKLVRYILNINTIWGWMILVAFALCVIRNYFPIRSHILLSELRIGDNSVTIRFTDASGKTTDYRYALIATPSLAGTTELRSTASQPAEQSPQVFASTLSAKKLLLTWNINTYGKYKLLLNDKVVETGRVVKLAGFTDAAFEYAKKGFEIAIGLVSSMVLCLGLMKVGEDAGIVQIVARVFHPVIRFLFPEVPKDHPANGAILMNITTSVLGLGNASTPFGLKAMQELESINQHKGVASNSQVMLLAYNTTGIALLPTTIIAARKAAGCSDPFEIIGTSLLAGSIATIVAIITAKLLGKLPFFSVQAAVAEDTLETITTNSQENQP